MGTEDAFGIKEFDDLVNEGFQVTFGTDQELGPSALDSSDYADQISCVLEGRAPQYQLTKDTDGSVSLVPNSEEPPQNFRTVVEDKPSVDVVLGQDQWTDVDCKTIRNAGDNDFRMIAKIPGRPERIQTAEFHLDLGFKYCVKKKSVDVKVDVHHLSAAVDNRFKAGVEDPNGGSAFGYYVDCIDIAISPQGTTITKKPRTYPELQSCEVQDSSETTGTGTVTASASPAVNIGRSKKRSRQTTVPNMRESSPVLAGDFRAARFRWEVIRWKHDNALEYDKIKPERCWLYKLQPSRRQLELPYPGDGPGIQKDSFWAIWEVPREDLAGGNTKITWKVEAVIQLRLIYRTQIGLICHVPGWGIPSKSWCVASKLEKFQFEKPVEVDLEIFWEAHESFINA